MAFFAIVIAVEAYKEDESFWDEFYALQNRERGYSLTVDNQIEKILEEVGFNTKSHDHKRINQIQKYTKCMSGLFAENASPSAGQRGREETPESLLARWMGSPDHKRNIQDPRHKYVGCARGRSGNNYSYLCAFRAKNWLDNLPPVACSNEGWSNINDSRLDVNYQRCGFPRIENIVSTRRKYPCRNIGSCCV